MVARYRKQWWAVRGPNNDAIDWVMRGRPTQLLQSLGGRELVVRLERVGDIRSVLTSDLVEVVAEQLPEGLRRRLSVEVKSDAYRMKATAIFADEHKRVWRCDLELVDVGDAKLAVKIPEIFIARLCVEA